MKMAFFIDTFCRLCERFITKEQGNKHLYSSRHLHRKENGYWPSYFPQRNLIGDESSRLQKAFWEMIFGTVDVLPVYGV